MTTSLMEYRNKYYILKTGLFYFYLSTGYETNGKYDKTPPQSIANELQTLLERPLKKLASIFINVSPSLHIIKHIPLMNTDEAVTLTRQILNNHGWKEINFNDNKHPNFFKMNELRKE